MPDYNLSGLSSGSFEQLIQAIALKVIGPGSVIFGAGPDGGREATFQGKMQYPSVADPWNGYLVTQAKFLQRPLGTTKDGQWLQKQLEGELSKFVKRKLKPPQYYLLCSNVTLSGVQDIGAKDSINRLFDKYTKQLPLKDYAVWDYDKLRSFLDDSADIRQAYLAWITPGDVLVRVMEWFDAKEPDFHKTISAFLQSDLLDDQYARLDQAGHPSTDLTPMAKLFFDLPVSDKPLVDPPEEEKGSSISPGFLGELLDVGARKLDPNSQSGESSRNRTKRSVSQNAPWGRYVLIGGPGQGKTTIGQFACQLYRAAILNDRPNLPPEVRDAVNGILQHCKSEKLNMPQGRRFPIRIVLNDFAKALADRSSNSLVEYITRLITERSNQTLSPSALQKWLGLYPWILVLDGLDEVPASTNRDAILRSVTQFLSFAHSAAADLLVLATTRPQGYDDDFSPEYYAHRYLTPLSNKLALYYGRRLADLTHGKNSTMASEVIANLRAAAEIDTTARLMRSPLQVTIMATLVARGGPAPQERWVLFRKYYTVIYDRETGKPMSDVTALLRTYRNHIDAIHHRVGLILQIESERTGQTDARLSKTDLSRIVRDRLQDEGLKGEAAESLQHKIIEAASDRLVFLVGVREGQVGFEIRSLQEFMAAEALTNGSDEHVIKRLNHIAPIVHWTNVFVFAAGKCFSERQHLRDTVCHICSTMNEPMSGQDVSPITLPGSQLALTLLLDGLARQHWNFELSLARIACRIITRPSGPIHESLASAYHVEIERVYIDDVHVKESTGSGQWSLLLSLADRGITWAQNLCEERLSAAISTPQGADIFMRSPDGRWRSERLEQVMRRVGPRCLDTLISNFRWQAQAPSGSRWLTAVYDIFIKPRVRDRSIAISLNGNSTGNINLVSIKSDDVLASWDLLVAEESWSSFAPHLNFLRQPSSTSLASALRASFQSKPARRFMWLSPWPLAACLAVCRSNDEAEALALRAERGDLGDFEDWLNAESRWVEHGVEPSDITAFDDHDCIIGPYLSQKGFPMLGTALDFQYSSRSRPEWLSIWNGLRNSKLRNFVANLIRGGSVDASLSVDQEIKMIRDTALEYSWCDGQALRRAINRADNLSDSLLNSLDALGRMDCRYYRSGEFSQEGGVFEKISKAYLTNRELAGLIPLLAETAPIGGHFGWLRKICPQYDEAPRFLQKAFVLLAIADADLAASEMPQLIERTKLLITKDPDFADAVFSRLERILPIDPRLRSMVVELYQEAFGEDIRATAVRVLDSLYQRKRSQLDDPQIRGELNLPFVFAAV